MQAGSKAPDGASPHGEIQELEHAIGQGGKIPGFQEELAFGRFEIQCHGQRIQSSHILEREVQEFFKLDFDPLGGCVDMESFHEPTSMGAMPELGAIEGKQLGLHLAIGFPRVFLNDLDGILALEEQFPATSGKRFSPNHLGETPNVESPRGFAVGTLGWVLTHECNDQMMMGIENVDGHLLVPGLEDMERQEGPREEHDLGQGEEGENGW